MKRQLLGVVLLGLAGTVISANLPKTQVGSQYLPDSIAHRGTLVADGDPFPPPFPPSCETKLSPQIIADGDPFPPPFPPNALGGLPEIA